MTNKVKVIFKNVEPGNSGEFAGESCIAALREACESCLAGKTEVLERTCSFVDAEFLDRTLQVYRELSACETDEEYEHLVFNVLETEAECAPDEQDSLETFYSWIKVAPDVFFLLRDGRLSIEIQ